MRFHLVVKLHLILVWTLRSTPNPKERPTPARRSKWPSSNSTKSMTRTSSLVWGENARNAVPPASWLFTTTVTHAVTTLVCYCLSSLAPCLLLSSRSHLDLALFPSFCTSQTRAGGARLKELRRLRLLNCCSQRERDSEICVCVCAWSCRGETVFECLVLCVWVGDQRKCVGGDGRENQQTLHTPNTAHTSRSNTLSHTGRCGFTLAYVDKDASKGKEAAAEPKGKKGKK